MCFPNWLPGFRSAIRMSGRNSCAAHLRHVVMNLMEGDANLGVVSYEIPGKEIELQEFFQDWITVIVPRDHPFVSREKILPEDLLSEPIIMREETSGTRKIVLSELAKHDISLDDLKNFMEVGNAEAIVRTVAAGYGISFVSKLAAACAIERGNVVSIPVEGYQFGANNLYGPQNGLKNPTAQQMHSGGSSMIHPIRI